MIELKHIGMCFVVFVGCYPLLVRDIIFPEKVDWGALFGNSVILSFVTFVLYLAVMAVMT